MQMVGARWRSGDLVIHHITLLSLSLSVCLTLSGWGGGQVSRPCFVIDGRVGIQKIAAGWILHRQWGKNNYNLVAEVNGLGLWLSSYYRAQGTCLGMTRGTSYSQSVRGKLVISIWPSDSAWLLSSAQSAQCEITRRPSVSKPGTRSEERSELFIMMEMIEPGTARINQEEIFSSTGRIFNWSGCGGCGVK